MTKSFGMTDREVDSTFAIKSKNLKQSHQDVKGSTKIGVEFHKLRNKSQSPYPLFLRKNIILQRMKQGKRFTAKEINQIVSFNDARKFISDLRRTLTNYRVCATRQPNHCNLYWLEPLGQIQPTLFACIKSSK